MKILNEKTEKFSRLLSLLLLLSIPLLEACGTLAGNPEEDESEDTPKVVVVEDEPKRITFNLTDAPIDGVLSVMVSIVMFEVSSDEDKWLEIPVLEKEPIDLLAYQNGESVKLAATDEIPLGTYKFIRLKLSDEIETKVVLKDGSESTAKVPSGEETGLKLKKDFTVSVDGTLDFTIDFDLRKSLSQKGDGSYQLKPKLRVVETKDTGSANVSLKDSKIACVYLEGEAMDKDDSCENAITSAAADDKGKIKLAFLPEGSYDVRIFKADGTFEDDRVLVEKEEVEAEEEK